MTIAQAEGRVRLRAKMRMVAGARARSAREGNLTSGRKRGPRGLSSLGRFAASTCFDQPANLKCQPVKAGEHITLRIEWPTELPAPVLEEQRRPGFAEVASRR